MPRLVRHAVFAAALLLAGCDMLGIESAQDIAARREADGKAVGSGCRQAARALEDCFALNRRSDKAAIFAGWREMNDYMRENNIADVMPTLAEAPKPALKDEPSEAKAAAPMPPVKPAAHGS